MRARRILSGIGPVAGGEDRLHGEVVPLADRVVLVVVAPGAAEGQAQEGRAGRVGGVGQPLVVELALDHRRLLQRRADAVQRAGGDGLGVVGPQLVAGDLLLDEAVERLVGVQGADHVVAVAPGVGIEVVGLEAAGVGVAGHVEPVPAPALAVLRRGEQAVDQPFVGVGPLVVGEAFDLVGRAGAVPQDRSRPGAAG